jgi:hypothetical protein
VDPSYARPSLAHECCVQETHHTDTNKTLGSLIICLMRLISIDACKGGGGGGLEWLSQIESQVRPVPRTLCKLLTGNLHELGGGTCTIVVVVALPPNAERYLPFRPARSRRVCGRHAAWGGTGGRFLGAWRGNLSPRRWLARNKPRGERCERNCMEGGTRLF